MTDLLARLLGRLPIGWLQLTHSRSRFATALIGVAFADILVLMQLGFLNALTIGAIAPYLTFDAAIILRSPDTNTFVDNDQLPRQRMIQALSVPGVADATAVYTEPMNWQRDDGMTTRLMVIGIDPNDAVFAQPAILAHQAQLKQLDTALLDRKTRKLPSALVAQIESGDPYTFEANNRTVHVIGTFSVGGSFEADGYMIVSDQTFMRMFSRRRPGAPNFIFIHTAPGADPHAVVARLRTVLPAKDTVVDTLADTAAADNTYQTSQRPVGVVFGFGVVIGILVGIVIVYQVLSTDVADHLSEYATMKAMGYRHRYLLGIIVEEAAILAILGFVPGLSIGFLLYHVAARATALPIIMTSNRAVIVFVGTLAMCALSGALASRKLARAEPADLF